MNFLNYACIFAIACFSISAFVGMLRLMRGPTPQDRVMGSELFAINSIMAILVLGIYLDSPWFYDIAMLMSLIGFVGSTALAKFLLRGEVIEP